MHCACAGLLRRSTGATVASSPSAPRAPSGALPEFAPLDSPKPARNRTEALQLDVTDPKAAQDLRDCDYLILAADSHQARAMFNALVHAYQIPGVQLGTRVEVSDSGDIGDIWSLVRPVFPDSGCLWCNGLVSPEKLADEALSIHDRERQRYPPRDDAPAPSVITLNAAAVTRSLNELLLAVVGLRRHQPTDRDYRRVELRSGTVRYETPRRDPACIDCGEAGLLARGDDAALPTQAAQAPKRRRRRMLPGARRISVG